MKTICYGELMVDMIAENVLAEADCFRRYAGGAAANVAVQLRRLGGESAFLGKLGADAFGDYLLKDLRSCRVDTGAVIRDPVRRTTVAFVGRDEKGIPEYLFYRMGGASDTIVPEEIDQAYLRQAGMLYSSSLMLTTPAVRRTTRWLFGFAKENGIPIAFDLNLRPTAWESVEEARATVEKIFEQIDILKINDEEMRFLLQRDVDPAAAGEVLLERYPALRVLLLTCGGKGTYLFGRDVGTIYVEPHRVKVVDTTGAGDSYMGAFLYACESCGGNMERLEEMGRYAAAAAELTIGARGAIQAMPEKERLDAYCRQQGIPVF